MDDILGSAATGDNSLSTSLTVSHTLGSGSNRKVIAIGICFENSAHTLDSCTYNGTSMTKIEGASVDFNGGYCNLYMYYIDETYLSSPGAYNCVLTASKAVDMLSLTVIALSDAVQGAPEDSNEVSNTTGYGENFDLEITEGSIQIGGYNHIDGTGSLAWGAGQTEVLDDDTVSNGIVGAFYQVGASAGTENVSVITTDLSSNDHGFVAISIAGLTVSGVKVAMIM